MKQSASIILTTVATMLINTGITIANDSLHKGRVTGMPVIEKISTTGFRGFLQTYEYDKQGRVLAVRYEEGSCDVYNYHPGLIIRKKFDANATIILEEILKLDKNGLVIRADYPACPGTVTKFFYNKQGKMIREYCKKETSTESETLFIYKTGGLLDYSLRTVKVNGRKTEKIKTIFFYGEPYRNTISSANYGFTFFGEESPLLYSTVEINDMVNDTKLMKQFSYVYDEAGRVAKRTEKNGAHEAEELFTYY